VEPGKTAVTIEQMQYLQDFNFAWGPIEDRHTFAERFAYHAEETELSLMLLPRTDCNPGYPGP